MKSKLTINVDTYLLEEAKDNHINFSSTMKEALQHKLAFIKQDMDGINIKITRIELEKEEKKLLKTQQKVSILRENIRKFEEKQAKSEENRLKNEKERMENAKKCIKCNKIIAELEKKHQLSKGFMCNGCYMTTPPMELRKWI